MTFAKRLRQRITQKGMTQAELGRMVGYENRSSISHMITQRNTPPLDKLVRITDILDISVDYLMGRTDCMHPIDPAILLKEIHDHCEDCKQPCGCKDCIIRTISFYKEDVNK